MTTRLATILIFYAAHSSAEFLNVFERVLQSCVIDLRNIVVVQFSTSNLMHTHRPDLNFDKIISSQMHLCTNLYQPIRNAYISIILDIS